MSNSIPDTVICYSPKPMSTYCQSSVLIDTPERWNLAYLSFDFDSKRYHPDPMFAVHVRRTSQMRLDGEGLDLVQENPSACVGALLTLMAPRFVYLIERAPVLNALPLYRAYGDDWVALVQGRARTHCFPERDIPEPDIAVTLNHAIAVIARVRRGGLAFE